MTFLGKIQLIQTREEYRIQVDVHQIEEIFPVLTGKRISSVIAGGERIHKRIQRTPNHQKKGITNRIAFATAQSRMLKYVGDTGRIHGNGT